jgi:hypothetical protein
MTWSVLNGQLALKQIREMIDESYQLVFNPCRLKEKSSEIIPVAFYFFLHNIRTKYVLIFLLSEYYGYEWPKFVTGVHPSIWASTCMM